MSAAKTFSFAIDSRTIVAQEGQTILEAADAAGIYIPRLCYAKCLPPHGSCRICTVLVNGRPQASCTQPAAPGINVENDTPTLREQRRQLVEMLLVEGNHFCPFCEKSGSCELQALAYRLGILAPRYPYLFPQREVDASHSEVWLDRNRCILCGRCESASRHLDGKSVFGFIGRGAHKQMAVSAASGLSATSLRSEDKAATVCPVGCILPKRCGYAVPIGRRDYDYQPIGSDIEKRSADK